MMAIQSNTTRIAKNHDSIIQNKEKNQSVETDPEMTQMAKDKDIN